MTADLEARVREGLGPDLEVVRKLGEGDHSVVFLAREPALQRFVAVKVLRPELAADAEMQQRFEREGRAAARIAHPNVATIYRVGRVDGALPFIVMEYIDGPTLEEAIAARGPLPVEEARRIVCAIAAALAAAHTRGIVHRDVRPANVFLENGSGRAVLSDFGIAGLLETGAGPSTRLTRPGQRLGQLRYMSPEQLRGEPTTEQSDIYALGLLAYETLAGRAPHAKESMAEMARERLAAEPPPLRELRPDVDPSTAGVVQRCLAAEPRRRPGAGDVARLLEAPASSSASPLADVEPGEPLGSLATFLAELKRRRVYRVLAAYCAFAFIALQAAQLILPAMPGWEWLYPVFVMGVLLGLPAAGTLAWVYDLTATGIRRTRAGSARRTRMRALPWVVLAATVAVVVAAGLLLLRARG